MRSISFVIPCYNEEKRLRKTFEALDKVVIPRGLKLTEVIFVDDGSIDKTFERINNFAGYSSLPVKIISYKPNRGKGYAIRQGMLESNSDYTLFFDADISTPLPELKKFVPFIKNGTDVVIGTRKNGKSTVIVHQPLYRELLGRAFTKLTQKSLGLTVTDFTCGFKAFSRRATGEIFPKTKINGWGYDAEILFLANKAGFKINEVAVTWSNDERTRVNLKSAIMSTLWELARIRINHTLRPAFKGLALSLLSVKNVPMSLLRNNAQQKTL